MKTLQQKSAAVILGKLGEGDKFVISFWGFKFNLEIKTLSVRNIVQISSEVSKMAQVNPDSGVFQAIMENALNLPYVCKCIAICTGSRIPFLSRIIMSLPLKDVKVLWDLIVKNSDPEAFFFIMASAKGMDKLMAKSGAVTASSEG